MIEIPEKYKEYANLIHRIAHLYPTNTRIEHGDYVNTGLAALVEAEKTFDPTQGVKFSTYAFVCVKNAIEKEFQDNANALSGCSPYIINEIKGERERISFLNNSIVSLSETKKSLDDRFQQEGWSYKLTTPLKEIIVESGIADPEHSAELNEMRKKVVEIIDTLEPEEKEIVYRRVYEGDTFQAMADAKNLTWRAINYRFFKVLDKLRDKFEEAGLEIYA